VREVGDQVLFLHRLVPGGADRSYGIEVGRLAGLPEPVLARAREVLALLEGEELRRGARDAGRGTGYEMPATAGPRPSPVPRPASRVPRPEQLPLFSAPPHPVVERLKGVDANTLTPLQALTLLAELAEAAQRA